MEIFGKIVDAVFPVFAVLLVFSCFNREKIKNTEVFRFLMVTVVSIVFIRMLYMMTGAETSSRYFYVLATIAICFSAAGLLFLAGFLTKSLNKKFPGFSIKYSIMILLLICSAICLGKAGRFKKDSKKWIYDTAEAIKSYPKSSEKTVLISNNPDRRAAYYGDSEFVKFVTEEDKVFADPLQTVREKDVVYVSDSLQVMPVFGMLATVGIKDQVGRYIKIRGSNGLATVKKTLEKFPKNTFILMRMSDAEFRKSFKDASVDFPFKLIKTMKDDKKREICLYVLKD